MPSEKKLYEEKTNTIYLNKIFIQSRACIFATKNKLERTVSIKYKKQPAPTTITKNSLHLFYRIIFLPKNREQGNGVNHEISIDFQNFKVTQIECKPVLLLCCCFLLKRVYWNLAINLLSNIRTIFFEKVHRHESNRVLIFLLLSWNRWHYVCAWVLIYNGEWYKLNQVDKSSIIMHKIIWIETSRECNAIGEMSF